MNLPKRPIKMLFSRGSKLFIAVLLTATIAPQISNIQVASADDGGYPWIDAHALYSSPDYTSSYGYALPCPAKDNQCDQGGSSLIATVGSVTYGEADTWHYGLRNCTSYAAWKINQVFGVTNISGWGNGKDWDTGLYSPQPYPVYNASGHTPQIGEIAQWESHTGDTYGHVAYVWKVESNGVADLLEYNQAYDGNFTSTRSTASNSDGTPDHYIHIGTTTNAKPGITPAAITVNGALNVFKVGGDQQVYQKYWNGSTWVGWTGLQGYTPSNPAAIINNGALNLFIRGNDGQIYTEYNGTNGWSGWTSLGSHQMKGDPYVMLYGTSMNVFALDTNGVPYEDTLPSGGTWTGWGSNTNYMASDPAAVSYGGKLHLIYRGGDNKPYENVFNGSGWTGFGEIGQYASVSGNPSALSYSAESELDVYFNTSVNQIWKDTNSGSGWGTWTQMGSSFNGDPDIMAYNNDLQIFARDTSNNVETRYWSYSGQSWSSWQSLGGSSDNLASDPYAYQNSSSELDLFASDGSANAYQDTKIAPNNWGGFSSLN